MVDKANTMKEAQKLLAKGQIDKAIELWQTISAAYPDGNTYNYIGDLYLKKGDKDGAVDEFHKAARIYMDEGFSLKALAIHKKVLNINPKDAPALIALGELNEQKNIITDAIKYYLAAADVLSKENKKKELLEVYDKILSLAPTNIKLRVKVSDLFAKEGFIPEAANEYSNIARLYLEKKDNTGALEWLTKAHEIQPHNVEVLMMLGDIAEKEGDNAKALQYMEMALDKAGETPDLLLKIAHFHIKNANYDAAAANINKVLKAEPGNIDARIELAELNEKTGDIMGAWLEYEQVVAPLIEADRVADALNILHTFKEFAPIENRKKLVTIYKMRADEDNAFSELVAMHKFYADKDENDNAIVVLREALEIKPDNEEVKKLIDALQGAGPSTAPPAEEGISREAPEAFFEEPAPGPAMEEPEEEGGIDLPTEPEPAYQAPGGAGGKSLDESMNEVDVFLKYGLYNDAKTLLEELKPKFADNILLHEKLKKVYTETKDDELRITECFVLYNLYTKGADKASATGVIKEAYALNPSDPRLEGKLHGVDLPKAPQKASLADHAEKLGEADFYMQQGFFQEAVKVYTDLLELFPESGDLKAKLSDAERLNAEAEAAAAKEAEALAAAEAEAAAEAAAVEAAAPEPEPEIVPFAGEEEESFFDFSTILDEVADEPDISEMDDEVAGIFDEFKKGLAQEIEAGDAETHYDLGIAYKEMGLLEDAVKEFQTAQRDPKYFSQSTTMIGMCYMSKGAYSKAIDAFSGALMKIDAGDETKWSIKYDLAEAYEKAGKLADAFQVFSEVNQWDSSFREVASKVDLLKSHAGGAKAPEAKPVPPVQASVQTVKSKDKKSRVSYI